MESYPISYEYKVFDLKDVLVYTDEISKDGYFAEDLDGKSKKDWDKAIQNGFRWIRTDGDLVILELRFRNIKGRKFVA